MHFSTHPVAVAALVALLPLVSAKTDLAGCVSTRTTNQWGEAVLSWYVPDTYEICAFLDCGGGRAPPKTTVPGCNLYSGTETYSPLYLDIPKTTAVASTTTSAAESTAAAATGKDGTSAASSETDASGTSTAAGTEGITTPPQPTATGSEGVASASGTTMKTKVGGNNNGTTASPNPQTTGSPVDVNGAGALGFSAGLMGFAAAVAAVVV